MNSEHFSINELTRDYQDKDIEKICITGSGGPFFKKTQLKNLKILDQKKRLIIQIGIWEKNISRPHPL